MPGRGSTCPRLRKGSLRGRGTHTSVLTSLFQEETGKTPGSYPDSTAVSNNIIILRFYRSLYICQLQMGPKLHTIATKLGCGHAEQSCREIRGGQRELRPGRGPKPTERGEQSIPRILLSPWGVTHVMGFWLQVWRGAGQVREEAEETREEEPVNYTVTKPLGYPSQSSTLPWNTAFCKLFPPLPIVYLKTMVSSVLNPG